MDSFKKEHYKSLLLQQRERHNQIIDDMKENNRGNNDKYASTELSNYDNHPGDLGSEVFEMEHNMALEVNEESQLKDIEDAIERLETDAYGSCQYCGKPINEERLDIVPYTKLCIDCENKKESDQEYSMLVDSPINRPVEEKVIDSPFGRKYLNKQEDDEYEGMDQLNDLMKYGSASTPQDMGGYHDYKEYYTNEDDKQGIVDDMDQISNEQYKKQLPD